MNKHIVFAISGCLFFINAFSQETDISELLQVIERNNPELKGYQSFVESQQLRDKSNNNLPDPKLSAYYLPFGDHDGGDYREYELTQSFEFPTVYAARSKWNASKSVQLEMAYAQKRQEVLLKAKRTLIEISYLQRQKEIEKIRQAQSKQVFDQIQELFKKEQVGILDLNKAKIAWIQEQFVVEQIESEIQLLLSELKTLNGGAAIDGISPKLMQPLEVTTLDVLWQEKLTSDPMLQELQASEAASLQQVKFEKRKVLPNIEVGYNYQGVTGSTFSGIYGGLSIPLWSSKNKVKAAEANTGYKK